MKRVKEKYRRMQDGLAYRLPKDLKDGSRSFTVTDDDIELTKVPKTDVSNFVDYDWRDGVIIKEEKETKHGPILERYIEDGKEHEAEQIRKALDTNIRRGMLSKEDEGVIRQRIKSIRNIIKEYKEDMDRLGHDLRENLEKLEMGTGTKQDLPKEIIDAFKKPGKKAYVAPSCESNDLPGQHIDLSNYISNADPGSFKGIAESIIDLHERKNKDYGNAAHESYKEFGIISYVIRLNDKLNRLKSLTKPGAEQQVADEKIEDTLMDLAAYAIMAIESMRT